MKIIRFLIPRLEYVLLAALFWSIAASGPKILNFDGDLPRHLLLGRLIRETGNVPTTDTFSFRTGGFPSIPHEWLSQVIFSISNDLLGLSGVVLLTALIFTATWAIVYYDAKRRSNDIFSTFMVIAIGIGASIIHVLPRPHLFTYLLTALWVTALEHITETKPRRWWWLPIMMVMWVNLHGMFVLGIIIWGIYLLGNLLENPSWTWFTRPATKALLSGGILSLLSTVLSPSGVKIWESVISLGGNSYITSRIPEYQSANFHLPETWPFILLLIITLTGFARTANKTPWTHVLLTASFAAIALYTSRMIPLFAIVTVPIAAKTLADLLKQEFPESRLSTIEKNISTINSSSNGIIWIFAVLLVVTLLSRSGKAIDPGNGGNVFDERFFPIQAVTWLNSDPQHGHMLNEFDWGGYLLLNLSPRQQIFMDGHTHIYGEALTREYETVFTLSDGWLKILDKYQIEWAIVRANSPIAHELENNGWKIIYKDNTTIVLRKK